MLQRSLKNGAKKGVVAGDNGMCPCCSPILSAIRLTRATSTRPLVGLAGVLDEDHRNTSFFHRLFRRRIDRTLIDAIGKTDGRNAEVRKCLRKQGFRSAVKWLGMHDYIAGTDEGQQSGRDRGHTEEKTAPLSARS